MIWRSPSLRMTQLRLVVADFNRAGSWSLKLVLSSLWRWREALRCKSAVKLNDFAKWEACWSTYLFRQQKVEIDWIRAQLLPLLEVYRYRAYGIRIRQSYGTFHLVSIARRKILASHWMIISAHAPLFAFVHWLIFHGTFHLMTILHWSFFVLWSRVLKLREACLIELWWGWSGF